MLPLDLHVLSLPPAFNLSHDQTLQFKVFDQPKGQSDLLLKSNQLLLHNCLQIDSVTNLFAFFAEYTPASAHNKLLDSVC